MCEVHSSSCPQIYKQCGQIKLNKASRSSLNSNNSWLFYAWCNGNGSCFSLWLSGFDFSIAQFACYIIIYTTCKTLLSFPRRHSTSDSVRGTISYFSRGEAKEVQWIGQDFKIRFCICLIFNQPLPPPPPEVCIYGVFVTIDFNILTTTTGLEGIMSCTPSTAWMELSPQSKIFFLLLLS